MSISITVRPSGKTSGGTDQTIPGEGEIDTREEAEAALTFLPEESEDTVVVGKSSYTRDQLIAIRDGEDAPSPDGETVAGDGVSHGVVLEGNGYGGLGDPAECEVVDGETVCGDPGHDGGGFALRYIAGIPLLNEATRLFLDPTVGFRLNHGNMDYDTPGGEEANSSFTSFGATAGADLRLVPPILEHRVWAALGLRFGVGGFTTEDSEKVSTPGNCTPGEFGRDECGNPGEPGAGPRTGNAGTKGVYNPRVGNSRGESGVALDLDIPVTLGVDILQEEWGTLGLLGQFIPGVTGLLPSGGDGFSYWHLGGGGGLVLRAGGSAAEVPVAEEEDVEDKDGDGVPNDEDQCVAEPGTKETNGCPKLDGISTSSVISANAADAAGQQFVVKLAPPRDGEITKAEIRGKDKTYGADVDPSKLKQTGEILVTPKEKLPAGKYTFAFELLGDDGKMSVGLVNFEVKDVAALDVAIKPDPANAPAEKTESSLTYNVTTNKKATIVPRFVLKGGNGTSTYYYPTPTSYPVEASKPGEAVNVAFKTPDNMPAGQYDVVFDVVAEDGTVKRLTSTMEVKKMDAKPVIEIAGSFKKGDALTGKLSASEKVAAPGLPVTYVVSGNGSTSAPKQVVLQDAAVDLNLTCPPALVTQGGKIYRTSKAGTYTVKVTYGNGKTVEKTFEVK